MQNNEREQRLEEIKASNKKAIPKMVKIFILCFLGGCLLGGVVGLVLVLQDNTNALDVVRGLGRTFSLSICPWLLLAWVLIQIGTGLFTVRRGNQLFAAWDGEDEAKEQELNQLITAEIWFLNMGVIVSLFFFGCFYTCGVASFETGPLMWGGTSVLFMVGTILMLMIQGKLVDLTRRMAPEKNASPYDMKFQKEWYSQCDEAEQAQIGNCSWAAYSAMNKCCVALWLIFVLTGIVLDTGFLPVLAVCVIWITGNTVYSREAAKADILV